MQFRSFGPGFAAMSLHVSNVFLLGYWKIRGWAGPIRLLLHYTATEFEEVLYECGEAPDYDDTCWTEKKFTLGMPFPNLPYLVDGEFKLTQSLAILRYLGKKLGLAGSGPEESAVLDMVADQLNDWRDPLYSAAYEPNYEELKVQKGDSWLYHAKRLEDFLEGKDFVLGSKISWTDFLLFETMEFQRVFVPGSLEAFPNLKTFTARVAALPQLEAYLKSDAVKWTYCNKMAAAKV